MRDICRSCNVYTDVVVMREKYSRSGDILINYFKCKNCGAKRFINYTRHDINEQKQKQTIIHEMTHAIIEAGFDLGDYEEQLAHHISLVLYQVLKDNNLVG